MQAFYGMIATFGFSFAPRDWAMCAGQIVSISQQTTLFSLLGDYFGGDGRVSFAYPDLRARMPVGSNMMGSGLGLPYDISQGERVGQQQTVIPLQSLPTHAHGASFVPSGGAAISVSVDASTSAGTKRTAAAGDYVAGQAAIGSKPDIYVDGGSAGVTVPLGGVSATGGGISGGTVTTDNAGSSNATDIKVPVQGMLYCICEDGIYPPRN